MGRPRVLSTTGERMRVVTHLAAVRDSLARHGPSTQDPKLKPILKQIGREIAKNRLPWLPFNIKQLSLKADRTGRYHRTPILPPTETWPEIYRIVAKDLGYTERRVRQVHSENRLLIEDLLPSIWDPGRSRLIQRDLRARALLTPQYYEKVQGNLVEWNGTAAVLDFLTLVKVQLGQERYRKAREFQSRCYAGGTRSSECRALGGYPLEKCVASENLVTDALQPRGHQSRWLTGFNVSARRPPRGQARWLRLSAGRAQRRGGYGSGPSDPSLGLGSSSLNFWQIGPKKGLCGIL